MTPAKRERESETSSENAVLRARARGEISCDTAFEKLYRECSRTVLAWLALRVERPFVEDLAQDVWLIFYSRFRRWQFGTEMESAQARPVLSFLFRTCRFVIQGHRRATATRSSNTLEKLNDLEAATGPEQIHRSIEAGRTLTVARQVCTEEELEVLLGKLSGLSARDISQSLGMTEAVVDHRYRNALARIREKMKLEPNQGKDRG